MNIYAIRDRLIDYYLQPFAGPGDKEVQAAISEMINGGREHAISQAPHHYELWKLGEVEEGGHIKATRELVCDCASLVRRSLRESGPGEPGNRKLEAPEGGSAGQAGEAHQRANAHQRPPQEQTQAKVSPRAEITPGSGRLD